MKIFPSGLLDLVLYVGYSNEDLFKYRQFVEISRRSIISSSPSKVKGMSGPSEKAATSRNKNEPMTPNTLAKKLLRSSYTTTQKIS
ncbi:hypothetical protein X975_11270, partial [Stegodyphus mimosarum]